jgi:hypothetical protein
MEAWDPIVAYWYLRLLVDTARWIAERVQRRPCSRRARPSLSRAQKATTRHGSCRLRLPAAAPPELPEQTSAPEASPPVDEGRTAPGGGTGKCSSSSDRRRCRRGRRP